MSSIPLVTLSTKLWCYIWHYQKKVSLSIKLFQVWKAVCLKTCNFLQKLLKMPSMQTKLQLQGTFLKGHAWSCLCNLSDQSRFLNWWAAHVPSSVKDLILWATYTQTWPSLTNDIIIISKLLNLQVYKVTFWQVLF